MDKEKIKGTSKKFTDNPTVFNRTQKEMEKTLNKLIPGKLSWKRINRKYKNIGEKAEYYEICN